MKICGIFMVWNVWNIPQKVYVWPSADGLPARPTSWARVLALVLPGHLFCVLRKLQGIEEFLDLAVENIVEVIDR